MAKKSGDDLFLKVTDVINKIYVENGLGDLDLVSRSVLVHICGSAEEDGIRVTDVMDERSLGSRQTIHGRIHELVEKGWLTATTDRVDGRAKLLAPSPQTQKVIGKISASLRGVIR